MRKNLSIVFALIGWFAVITQYILLLNASTTGFTDTTIRFFSFFTILTNSLVSLYFTQQAILNDYKNKQFLNFPGFLTAITVYIFVVGLVYQIILRQTYNPEGMDLIVNELLHSLMPLLVLLFWYLYEDKTVIKWKSLFLWLIYPFIYIIIIMISGSFSNYYPYPFINVLNIGLKAVLINSFLLLILFMVLSVILVGFGKWLEKKKA
ncbi:MAG: Pr6Pr family membrane protein [Oligoflexus sp.]|nr:Pr6Pr family membrane protein [Pseudopedobacter sp.]